MLSKGGTEEWPGKKIINLNPKVVKKWSKNGQKMVKKWSKSGQTVVKNWSNSGQKVVKQWSKSGQKVKIRQNVTIFHSWGVTPWGEGGLG